jgi:lipopolysaccharide biosynthesis glycosyltransferase
MFEYRLGVNVVLACDNNYAQHLGVAIVSLIENYKDSRNLFIHVFYSDLSPENKLNLEITGKRDGVSLIFYNITNDLLKDCPEVNHLSRATYARLLISELLPAEINRVIYLDSDIVVLGNIGDLYNQDLGKYSLGAVEDVMAKEILQIYFQKDLSNYFNAGVLLINLDSWRQKDVKNRAWDFIKLNYNNIVRADQDVLNCLFKNDWRKLDNRFNLDLKRRSLETMPGPDTVILHYSDRLKPWHYAFSGSSASYYFFYLEKTPWKNFKFKDNNFLRKYYFIFIKKFKISALPYIPDVLLKEYRRLLWKTYKMKK